MSKRHPTSIPFSLVAIALAAMAFCACPARGDDVEKTVLRHGVSTPLSLPEYNTSQGVGYASIKDLARQLGGSMEITDTRVLFRLDGAEAEVGLNDTEVAAGDGPFDIGFPILAYEGDALIAMDDVVPFLREGFRFGTPEEPPTTSALQLPDTATAEPIAADSLEGAMESTALDGIDDMPLEEDSLGLESIEISPASSDGAADVVENTPALVDGAPLILAIDPGHGGEDNGVVGPNGLVEKDLCLAIATNLRRILKEQYGIDTVMTRDKDESVTPQTRFGRATAGQATLVLSLHGGASNGIAAQGYQVFAHRPKRSLSIDPRPALGAAKTVATSMDAVTKQPAHVVREVPLLIMRQGSLPCILVELGNLINPEEEAKLATEAYQRTLAAALAQGIDAATSARAGARNSS